MEYDYKKYLRKYTMKKLLISVLVLALMIIAAGGICSNQKQPLKKHVDPTGSFSFDVRGRWLVADNENHPNVIGWFLVGDKNNDTEFVAAEVIVTRIEAESVPEFSQYVELEKELIDQDQAIEPEVGMEVRFVDGRKAFRRQLSFNGAEFSNKPGNRFAIQYYIDGTDAIWGITIVTTSQNRPLVSEIEDTMLKSFKFLKEDKAPAISEIGPGPAEKEVTGIALKRSDEDRTVSERPADATPEIVKVDQPSSGAEITEQKLPGPVDKSIDQASIETPQALSKTIEEESPEENNEELDSTPRHPIWLPKIGNE
jgi:hypothetical protein